eukprot:TRINITY_DN13837_c0_g1_i1.p1 TRINITY_DN13837_c0_g1~~TRINITY_DN13837_c0_g1_i1.p1  ORF type:complete len:453 (-),score=109.56 TRINITY_DN13837_c0_g1_i1:70-1374(-)
MSELLGLFFAEFDNIVGPKVTHQVPDKFIASDVFTQVSDYIIPDNELCFKFITLNVEKCVIAGYPVRIENKKYHRNQLLFNVGVVVKPEADTGRFEPICRKLGETFKSLELENEYVFDQTKRAALPEILVQIFCDLKSNGECTTRFDSANIITLKILPALDPPGMIHDHEVPILVKEINPPLVKFWDLTLHQILPFLDGTNHVKKIAKLANVDSSFVKTCLRQLVYYNLVKMIDIFQFSNIYRINKTEQLQKLYVDVEFQDSCLSYLSFKTQSLKGSKGAFDLVFSIFCQMSSRPRVSEIVRQNATGLQNFNLSIKRIITFGLLNGIIARVHKYPVLTGKFDYAADLVNIDRSQFSLSMSPPTPLTALTSVVSSPAKFSSFSSMSAYNMEQHLVSMLDGKHSMDKICCEFEKSFHEMTEILSRLSHLHLTYLSM